MKRPQGERGRTWAIFQTTMYLVVTIPTHVKVWIMYHFGPVYVFFVICTWSDVWYVLYKSETIRALKHSQLTLTLYLYISAINYSSLRSAYLKVLMIILSRWFNGWYFMSQ